MTMEPPASLHCGDKQHKKMKCLKDNSHALDNNEVLCGMTVFGETHMKEGEDDVFFHGKQRDAK